MRGTHVHENVSVHARRHGSVCYTTDLDNERRVTDVVVAMLQDRKLALGSIRRDGILLGEWQLLGEGGYGVDTAW